MKRHSNSAAPATTGLQKAKLLSVPDALKFLPVAREPFYKKLKSGELPCYKFGRKVFIDLDEVLRAMKQPVKTAVEK